MTHGDDLSDRWFGPVMHKRLVSFARRYVGDHGEAEDLAQETLLRAGTGLTRLRSTDRAEAWLFRICRHAAIDHVRARRVRRGIWGSFPDEGESWVALQPDEREEVARQHELPAVDLSTLPAHHRLLMALYYEKGLSQAVICRMTGLSATALRVRLYRARRRLAAAAESDDQGPSQLGR